TIQVRVEGAHSGEHAMVLPYGSTMRAVLEKVRPNSMSQMNAVQLYRPSVAQRQKEMLNLSLQKLEEASLSAQSSTKEEASLAIIMHYTMLAVRLNKINSCCLQKTIGQPQKILSVAHF
ncbi:MAG: Polysialic acid transport protein kpsD, partial [Escherichia coli DORA_A_5_14_21]